MKNKMVSMLNILVIILVSFSSCAKKNPKIAFFLYDGSDTFIIELWNNMVDKMPAGVSFEVRDAGNSQVVQNQQIVELIDRSFDLFVINAVDRLACSSIVEKCAQKRIPVIFFNREPLEDALKESNVFYVGAAADSLGEKQANMVAELFTNNFPNSKYDKNNDGIIQLIILKGEQGHQDAEKRTDNCVSRLKELEFRVNVLSIEVDDWKRQDAYETMKLLYRQFGNKIELVFSNNDDMALGAIDYLLERRIFHENSKKEYNQPFVIVGVDGTLVGLEAIDRGLLYGTVNNDSLKQADATMTLAKYIIENKSLDDLPYAVINDHYIYIDGDIITHSNLQEYINNK